MDIAGFAFTTPIGVVESVLGTSPQHLLNVSAQLEPDADGDGYGDETQDGCPTDASTHGPCPAIDNSFAIGKKKVNKKKGTAKITVIVPGRRSVAADDQGAAASRRLIPRPRIQAAILTISASLDRSAAAGLGSSLLQRSLLNP